MNQAVYEIICSVRALTGLGVCLYDKKRFFSSRYGILQKDFRGHYCEYCNAVKSFCQKECDENDEELVGNLAMMYRRPFFNVCHAGVCEYIVPVIRDEKLVATLFIGQCRIDDESVIKRTRDFLSELPDTPEMLERVYMKLPETTREVLTSAGRLADGCLSQLADLPTPTFGSLPEQARHYIDYGFMNDISLSKLAEMLHVNPSYLSRAYHREFGMTISEHLLSIRVEQAKKLLAFTKIPVTHISFNVGFSDPNYFARVFRKKTGVSPSEYRKGYSK